MYQLNEAFINSRNCPEDDKQEALLKVMKWLYFILHIQKSNSPRNAMNMEIYEQMLLVDDVKDAEKRKLVDQWFMNMFKFLILGTLEAEIDDVAEMFKCDKADSDWCATFYDMAMTLALQFLTLKLRTTEEPMRISRIISSAAIRLGALESSQ